jgi:hypothetical protein
VNSLVFSKADRYMRPLGVAQEGLHNIKLKKLKAVVVKIDLSKAFDRVNWLYLRMLLIHLGFGLDFTNWVMACLSSVSFSILLNGSPQFLSSRKRNTTGMSLFLPYFPSGS